MAAVLPNGSLPSGEHKKSPTSSTTLSNESDDSFESDSNESDSSNSNEASIVVTPHVPDNFKKAYMIYGHGTDNPDKFTVPPDCYIVAIGEIGAVMSLKQFEYSIKALCALHKQYFLS